MPSLYSVKPRFQTLLRPVVRTLADAGVTANAVTVTACALSVALGLLLAANPENRILWLLLPLYLFIRMALNAIDGMLAREHHQQTALGAYLNELADVVSDSFLYVPFAFAPGFDPLWVGAVIVLSAISEMTGTVAVLTGASRRYDGPLGKSDRAFVFGALGLWLGLGQTVSPRIGRIIFQAIAVLLIVTIINRIRAGLAELQGGTTDADCGNRASSRRALLHK